MSFEHIIEYPMPITFDGGLIVCIESIVTLEIEPEYRGSRDWAITGISMSGHRMQGQAIDTGKPKDHEIPKRDPMFKAIRDYAMRTHDKVLQAKFSEWLDAKCERVADDRRDARRA
jgi:hypothetical protein